MKRKATPLLFVALTACSGAIENPDPKPTTQQGGGGGSTTQPEPGTTTEPKRVCDVDLNTLNQEVSYQPLDASLKDVPHFRCLCDDKGYPLVGNINGKNVSTASEFCQALREKNLL